MSPKGTNSTPAGIGSNGARLSGWPVMARAPMVRPWKPWLVAMIRRRPVMRASLNAASLASVPELQNITRVSSAPQPVSSMSFSASFRGGSEAKMLDTWPNSATCFDTASTMAGLPWPRTLTAMPASRSR